MQVILPQAPFVPVSTRESMPVCEWIMPATAERRDYFTTCKRLPAGTPDCLHVSVEHSDEGIERCTAAIYAGRAYVIHYEFKPLQDA
jgi:hypothetical protein